MFPRSCRMPTGTCESFCNQTVRGLATVCVKSLYMYLDIETYLGDLVPRLFRFFVAAYDPGILTTVPKVNVANFEVIVREGWLEERRLMPTCLREHPGL